MLQWYKIPFSADSRGVALRRKIMKGKEKGKKEEEEWKQSGKFSAGYDTNGPLHVTALAPLSRLVLACYKLMFTRLMCCR